MAIDYIQKNIGGFSKWENNKKLLAEISKNQIHDIILARPHTYMNESGKSVKSLIISYHLSAIDLCIIHDDFDIPLGEYKLEQNRGAGGHKGVQSIIDTLGTNEFWRLRIGIRPLTLEADLPNRNSACIKAENFVLKKFTREEKTIINKTILEAVKTLLEKPLATSH